MAIFLSKATASQEIMLGPFVDATDGFTAETGLTIANTDIRVMKHGGTTFANKNSGGATHVEDGYYTCTLDDTDTSAAGALVLNVTVSGARPVRHDFNVLPGDAYGSLVTELDRMNVDVTQWDGSAVATPNSAGTPKVDMTHADGQWQPMSAFVYWFRYALFQTNISAATSTTVTTSLTGYGTDEFVGRDLAIMSDASSNGQTRRITAYNTSTGVFTVAPAFSTTPDTFTDVFILPASNQVDVAAWDGAAVATPSVAGVPEVDVTLVSGSATVPASLAYWSGATHTGLAQAGAAGSITLASGEAAASGTLDGNFITIASGTGEGQTRRISTYFTSTKVASVSQNWWITPDNTSYYFITPAAEVDVDWWNGSAVVTPTVAGVPKTDATYIQGNFDATTGLAYMGQSLLTGIAQGGGASTITLASGFSASNDVYNNQFVTIVAGPGDFETRRIIDYVGSTRVATVDEPWVTTPTASSYYFLHGYGAANANGWDGAAVATPTVAGVPTVDTKYMYASEGGASYLSAWAQGMIASSVGAVTSTTIVLSSLNSTDDFYNGRYVAVYSGTGAQQVRLITDYVGSTKTATVTPAWATNPVNGASWVVIQDSAQVDVVAWDGTAVLPGDNGPDLQLGT